MTTSSDIQRWQIKATVSEGWVEEEHETTDTTNSIRRKPRRKVWKVEHLIDTGAFGEVRLEKAVDDGKLRAVKKIPVMGLDLADVEYEKELRALAQFSRPKSREASVFVEFYGWFKHGSHVFLAMEYIPLGNLEKNMSAGKVPEVEARDIIRQILLGLKIMHAESFAHRDLKPKNVLVVSGPPKWLIKLADFGLSKRLTESSGYHTQAGTEPYMAPEILPYLDTNSSGGEYTNAVDLWAVGCIAYRIITGVVPFRPAALVDYCRDSSQFPSDLLYGNGVRNGSSYSNFVQQLLATDPKARPSALQALNHAWIISGSISTRRPGDLPNREGSDMSVSTSVMNYNTGTHNGLKSYNLTLHDQPSSQSNTASATSSSAVSNNLTVREKPLPALPFEPILAPPTFESSISALKTFKEHQYWVQSVAFSPDGKTLALAMGDAVLISDIATGDILRTLKYSTGLAWHAGIIWCAAFSPDGKMVATASENKNIQVWDVARGILLRTIEGHGLSVRCVTFSSDSKVVASGSADQTVRLWDVATGTPMQALWGHQSWVRSVAVSPNGKLVASGSGDRSVRIFDTATGIPQAVVQVTRNGIWAVNFSPDGKLLAYASDDGTILVRDMATGKTVHTLSGHIRTVRRLVFTNNCKLLVSASEDLTVRLWDLATGTCQIFVGHTDSVNWVAISPDESVMASASEDKTIKLWDLESLKQPPN